MSEPLTPERIVPFLRSLHASGEWLSSRDIDEIAATLDAERAARPAPALDVERLSPYPRHKNQVRASFSIPADLAAWVREVAARDGVTISAVVSASIEDHQRAARPAPALDVERLRAMLLQMANEAAEKMGGANERPDWYRGYESACDRLLAWLIEESRP